MGARRPAWLKQLDVEGFRVTRIPLDGLGEFPLGRGVKLVDDRFWTLVTGEAREVVYPGQLITTAKGEYVFGDFFEAHRPELEAPLAADPSSSAARQIYADWLQEQGDCLGERISAGMPNPPEAREGVGPEAALEWKHGLLTRALLRETPGTQDRSDFTRVLLRVLNLRAAAFVQQLVIDVQTADRGAGDPAAIRGLAEKLLARLPALPALQSLSLGYCLTAAKQPPIVAPLGDPRFPRLDPGPVFTWALGAHFEVVDATRLDGARKGDRLNADGLRLRRMNDRIIVASQAEPRGTWRWASSTAVAGRILLSLNRDLNEIRIGGQKSPGSFLLPGDLVDVFSVGGQPAARLRFGLDRW